MTERVNAVIPQGARVFKRIEGPLILDENGKPGKKRWNRGMLREPRQAVRAGARTCERLTYATIRNA